MAANSADRKRTFFVSAIVDKDRRVGDIDGVANSLLGSRKSFSELSFVHRMTVFSHACSNTENGKVCVCEPDKEQKNEIASSLDVTD